MKQKKGLVWFLSFALMVGTLLFPGLTYKTHASNESKKKDETVKSSPKTVLSNKDGSVTLTKLNNQVWVHTTYTKINGNSVPANGLLITSSKGLLLVDVTWNDQLASELLKLIDQHFHKPIKKAMITHHKIDRIGGIRTLLKENIPVVSTTFIAKMAKEAGYPQPKPLLDNHPVMKFGKTIVETYYPGEGHTRDNITVWLPQYKILFGDMIFSLESQGVGIIDEANMNAWPYTIQNLMNKYPDAKLVIPGHKNWGDYSLLPHTLETLKKFKPSH